MPKAYMTIDDSFSARSHELVDYLAVKNIPSLFFCRGDMMERYPDQVDYALGQGVILANHSYAHQPAGTMQFEEWKDDFEKTETLIGAAYEKTGIRRPGKYFRFPYLDRGDGDKVEQRFPALIKDIKQGNQPSLPEDQKVINIQRYLSEKGFSQPFENVDHPIYTIDSVAQAHDCLMTFSSCDWMMRTAHKNKGWPYQSVSDLKGVIDVDPYLTTMNGNHVVLFHDHAEIIDTTIELIDHMLSRGIEFIPIKH